jgi:hypothetical protein
VRERNCSAGEAHLDLMDYYYNYTTIGQCPGLVYNNLAGTGIPANLSKSK